MWKLLAPGLVLGGALWVLATPPVENPIRFREISQKAGITGITVSGRPGGAALIEANGSGVCWLDYDNDGWLDLYVVNGATLDDLPAAARGAGTPYRNYLYHNNGNGTFTDVTEKAGVAGRRWGTGCAAADYDNDGRVDLFVANIGECLLYRNNGDGTFTDVARKAGVAGGLNWHTGAAFGDYDGDGRLDLYVAGYVELSEMLAPQKRCSWRGVQVFCGPGGFRGAPDALYHNNGDGTFSDVTRAAGVEDRDLLYGLTVSFEDFDNDGRPDIFVANDRGRNYLYHNLGNGKFEETGETWGAAYPVEGRPQANMGVALGDYDHNGATDIFVTAFSQDHYTLYQNTGNRLFLDVSSETGIASVTHAFLGWGVFFADFDNDGWLDLFAANGHVYPEVDRARGFSEGFAQRPLLFRQASPGIFLEVGLRSGLGAVSRHSSRGSAWADFNNDGNVDIVYTNLHAAPTLLENITNTAHHWIAIKTAGTRSNRDGIGAKATVRAGGLVQHASVRSGESYLSCNDPRMHFGLGPHRQIDEIEIRWPSGRVDRLRNVPADRIVTIQEGGAILQTK
jgi:hypothetical protein